jgi:hypothetical protein
MTDPILMSVATALATKAATGLYELVKQKFGRHPERARALEAAEGKPAGSAEVATLAEALAAAGREDPAFAQQLRAATRVDVRNVVSGTVSGHVVQVAGDVQGNIELGGR